MAGSSGGEGEVESGEIGLIGGDCRLDTTGRLSAEIGV